MSPAAKLLRLIVAALDSKATLEDVPVKIRTKEAGVLANNENETTVGSWLRDESSNKQFSALIAWLEYLPQSKIAEILGEILPKEPKSIKQTLEEYQRSQKTKQKPKKKKPAKYGASLIDHPPGRN